MRTVFIACSLMLGAFAGAAEVTRAVPAGRSPRVDGSHFMPFLSANPWRVPPWQVVSAPLRFDPHVVIRPVPVYVFAPECHRTACVEQPMGALEGGKQPVPAIPQAAVDARIEGRVIVWYTIGIDGRVVDVEIANAEPRGVFEDATVAAVAQWTWEPVADKYGVAIEVRSSSLIEFLMDSESN